MAELPVLPLRVGDLLSDTTHMSAEEFGAYCRILFTMWRHGGRLADDTKELAHVAGVTPQRWKAIAERVRRPLTSAGGELSQKRLTDTWLSVQDLRKKRAGAANIMHSKRDANAPAKQMHMHMQTDSKTHANQDAKVLQNPATKTKIKKESSSSEYEAARARSDEMPKDQQDNTPGSLATALCGGALTRPPDAEQAAQESKRPSDVSRAEWDAMFAARRATANSKKPDTI